MVGEGVHLSSDLPIVFQDFSDIKFSGKIYRCS
jgi:hypothetical protein